MDSDINDDGRIIEITAKHAVLIPSLQNIKSLMSYVEAVAVVIGSRHIHSVFEDQSNVKIYLTDEKFVDILVNNGITILGRRVNVDYVVPRADKVLLTNVDPIIPDSCLMNILAFYGSPASTIIHDKIATNSEYSHIECGSRKIYMQIFEGKKLPSKINFTYQGTCYQIDIMVEEFEKSASDVVGSFVIDERNEDEAAEVDSIQSVKPNIEESSDPKLPSQKQLAYWNRRNEELPSATLAARQIKRRAKNRWLKSKVRRVKRAAAPDLGTSTKSTKIKKPNQKFNSSIGKRLRKGIRRNLGNKNISRKVTTTTNAIEEINLESDKSLENMDTISNASDSLVNGQLTDNDANSLAQYPLSREELEKFMFKTRFNREPIQVAHEFLSEKQIPDGFNALKAQLIQYRNICKESNTKLRIKRLISLLQTAEENKKTD